MRFYPNPAAVSPDDPPAVGQADARAGVVALAVKALELGEDAPAGVADPELPRIVLAARPDVDPRRVGAAEPEGVGGPPQRGLPVTSEHSPGRQAISELRNSEMSGSGEVLARQATGASPLPPDRGRPTLL